MSHTIQDEVIDMRDSIQMAIANGNDTELFRLADIAAEADNMELAEVLRNAAKRARLDDQAYDEAKDNQM